MTEGSTVARAFEIAHDGTCQDINDIRRQLELENYSNVLAHLAGPSIQKQLTAILKRRS
jgi:hypothetical protein